VAQQTLRVLDHIHGVLIPSRPPQRLLFMQGYGVLLAYLHDVGMSDFSPAGRAMHPEFASQAVFDPDLDDVIADAWQENGGNVAWRLSQMAQQDILAREPQLIFREILALSFCHSKSKVPVEAINELSQLRQLAVEVISTDLSCLYHQQKLRRARLELAAAGDDPPSHLVEKVTAAQFALTTLHQSQPTDHRCHNPHLAPYYQDVAAEAFDWLQSPHPQVHELVQDVIDSLRVLRCADALRQRGTVLKTSGGYEIFASRYNGRAITALRLGQDKMFLLESSDPISAGEANLASSELDRFGDLRISFARGDFSSEEAANQAAVYAAIVLNDMQEDILGSFHRPHDSIAPAGLKCDQEMKILLEETDSFREFAQLVKDELLQRRPDLGDRVQVVPSLTRASELERNNYLNASPLPWDEAQRIDLLRRIGRNGHRTDLIDPAAAFEFVRLLELQPGQLLIESGSPPGFVYIPLGPGLHFTPVGGYQSFALPAWVPVGHSGVIRGAARNAMVTAERAVSLLVIPRTVFLHDWYHTHTPDSLREALSRSGRQKGQEPTLSVVERALRLQSVSIFAGLDHETLQLIAEATVEMALAAGQTLFKKGDTGDALYVVLAGTLQVHDGQRLYAQRGPGQVLGDMALLTGEPRMASVTALSPCHLLRLDRSTMDDLIEQHGKIGRGLIAVLSERLRQARSEQ
jgi:CRP-like cAMP-binding protein